jgi:phosphoglycerol transferase MdoB-like AlkP superfamily enzyme
LIWGNLLASGFGAYTMRTEYGVLFGRGEEELGFRMYDPYLTAIADVDHAIPNKLRMNGWRSVFVHPHDMRFYNRHTLLPKAGFTDLVGENHFEAPPSGPGRYVKDAAVAEKIIEIARAAEAPTFIYAVTMENHGPWARHGGADPQQMIANYNRLVKAGDSMLGRLREGVASLGQPALLAFFGDHRPSIPGASEPGGPRHTPFVMIQFDAQGRITGQPNARLDLTPAQLHHAIVELTQGSTIVRD